MKTLKIRLIWPGCAQGKYILRARGCILAVLFWGDPEGPLQGWGPLAYVPVDPAGNGTFFFAGRRAIPREATHVWARCYAGDFGSYEDISEEIPAEYRPEAEEEGQEALRFSVLTDLHLSTKPFRVRQALAATKSDKVLLLGDLTNDGLSEQFTEFRACLEETVPEKLVLSVPGNHDVLHALREGGEEGCRNYDGFQRDLLRKAEGRGYRFSFDPEGRSYAVQVGEVDVIGLACVTTGRRFLFPEGRAIDWLQEHLASTPASWHLILCHAPLLAHNPNRTIGMPYLDKNKRLQELIDQNGRIIFLSGHTHVSPNLLRGNVEYDKEHGNLYLDAGSVVATDISGEEGLLSPDWRDGCVTELSIGRDSVEICMSSIGSGVRYPRGHYRFEAQATGEQP